jgi:hypothetical protein
MPEEVISDFILGRDNDFCKEKITVHPDGETLMIF